MAQNGDAKVDTGIDYKTRRGDDIEVYMDDGEHAVTYHITELTHDEGDALEVVKMYHEAGLSDEVGVSVVDTDKAPAKYARENLLRAMHVREEMECAKSYWE